MIIDIDKIFIKESEELLNSIFLFDESFELSPDEVNKIIESCNNIDLNILQEANIILETGDYSKGLSKAGIDKSKINKAGNEISGIIKKEGINSKSKEKIHNIVSKLFEEIATDISIEDTIIKNGKLEDVERPKLKRALILIYWVIVINTLALSVLQILGPVGQIIGVSIVAPLCEESAKAISIKGNFEKEFWLVFNTFEFTSYIIRGIPGLALAKSFGIDFTIKNLVRGRAAAVGLHTINTLIHKLFNNEKFRKKFNIKDDEDAKDKSTFIGFVITVLIHGTWNAAASLSPTFNSILSGTDISTTNKLMGKD